MFTSREHRRLISVTVYEHLGEDDECALGQRRASRARGSGIAIGVSRNMHMHMPACMRACACWGIGVMWDMVHWCW
jgi:hypothetical protein